MANSSGSRSSQNGASQVKNSVRRKSKKSRKRKIIKRTILIILLIVLVGAGIYVGPKLVNVMQLAKAAKSMADESTVDTFKDGKTTVIYDKNGDQLCTMKASKDMYYIDFDNIPSVLADSFVVMEDRDFYNHSGIDIKAIIRAIIANRKSDTIVQGASTITQQVAKNVFLSQEVTWERKIKEIFLAWELEKMYSKEQMFGMESVKQRIIETVIQINRTHTLPSYGILLIGPAGTGKSQIAYLVAKILKMPWTTLDEFY